MNGVWKVQLGIFISREGNTVIVRRKTEVYVEVESISDDEGFLGNRMISS